MKVSKRMQKLLELLAYFRRMRHRRAANEEEIVTAWNPETLNLSDPEQIAFSNENKTALVTDPLGGGNIFATKSHSSGNKMIAFSGIWTASDGVGFGAYLNDLTTRIAALYGSGYLTGSDPPTGHVSFEPEEVLLMKVRFGEGMIFFGTVAAGFNGDPEAGTEPDIMFEPNTELVPTMEASSADGEPVGGTIDGSVSEGSFEAWDS